MKIGLVGFPGSGKTTVFNALTGQSVHTGFGAERGKTHLGTVKVPDERVDALAQLYHPKKTTFAEITFSDVAPVSSTAGRNLDEETLRAMREVDALCQVVRGFTNDAGDPPNPLAEATALEDEMNLSDLLIIEKRLERLQREHSKTGEADILQTFKSALEAGTPIRRIENVAPAAWTMVSGFRFLTQKPLLLVLNVAEEDAAKAAPEDLVKHAEKSGLGLVVLSGKVEMDIAAMSAEEQQLFLEDLGLKEPAVGRFIHAAYSLLDLISFLTGGPDECRAWPIKRGLTAPRAAGKIHSDIERGFIRAEVVRWDDLVHLGSEAKCREAGKLRSEGKEYVVHDGDVINFRFNV